MITDVNIAPTGSALSIVTLAMAKKQLHIEESYTEEDDLITTYIESAVTEAENYIGGHILQKDLEYKLDQVQNPFVFEAFPFKEISEVKYFKKDGTEETMPATDYSLTKLNDKVFQIRFKQVPEIANQWDAMTIKAVVGMASVPKPIYEGILLMVSDMYERREDRVEVPLTAAISKLRPYKKF